MTKREQARRLRLLPDGKPKHVRIYDNGGESVDRYTVVFSHLNTGYCHVLGMSGAPFYPQGFCQHMEYRKVIDKPRYSHLGKKITFEQLPADCQRVVLMDYCDFWNLEEEMSEHLDSVL